jgi:NTP pyrophosphatase (non-canonical NTP hydrolase)
MESNGSTRRRWIIGLTALVVAGTVGGSVAEDVSAAAAVLDRAKNEPVAVAIAGPDGPVLARSLLRAAAGRGLSVATTPPADAFADALAGQELVSLRGIIAVLRERCPWDRVQTARDIVSYTVEEVYELADAIAEDDLGEEHGELGDLLMQVYFLARLLEERGAGDVGSVAREIEQKLVRRHAHIFGDTVAETPGEVRGQWDRIKREQEGRPGGCHDVPATLPALLLARKLQERAAAVGFDWETAAEAFPKIAEEHAELAEAMGIGLPRISPADLPSQAAPPPVAVPEAEEGPGVDRGSWSRDGVPAQRSEAADDSRPAERPLEAADPPSAGNDEARERLRHEVGDLLFAVVNVARKAGVDPELALRGAARRFEERVCAAAALAQREGEEWTALELADQEAYYQRAKRAGEPARRDEAPDRTDREAR